MWDAKGKDFEVVLLFIIIMVRGMCLLGASHHQRTRTKQVHTTHRHIHTHTWTDTVCVIVYLSVCLF